MELFAHLPTEQRNTRTNTIDRLDAESMLRLMNEEDRVVMEAVAEAIPALAAALEAACTLMRAGGRLFYIGAGTSGRLGVLDASECPPTFQVPAEMVQGIMAGGEAALSRATEASEDDAASGAADLLSRGFEGTDVLCGIAASGRTPYVIGAIRKAREMGAVTIGLSCVAGSELEHAAEYPVTLVTGAEVITGSTRLKAGTATKLVLNMLSTGVMVKLGMTYGNLMVNVQPKNAKLRDRACRIIVSVAGVSYEEASRLLEESGDDVRRAIVMAKLTMGKEEAGRMLEQQGNVLSRVLGEG